MPAETFYCTREICQRCHRTSPVSFRARNDIWQSVAGHEWQHSILCVVCFAQLGDEKFIVWELGIEFYPVSFATHVQQTQENRLCSTGP